MKSEGKICTKCNKFKPLSDFSPKKELKDGLNTHCKACIREYHRARSAKNKLKPVQTTPKKCSACGEIKPAHMFGKCRSKKGGLYHKCKLCTSKYISDRYKKFPELRKRYKHKTWNKWRYLNSRCKRLDIKLTIPKKEFIEWYDSTENKCHYCGCDLIISDDRAEWNSICISRKDIHKGYCSGNLIKSCLCCVSSKDVLEYSSFIERKSDRDELAYQGLKRCSKCGETKSFTEFRHMDHTFDSKSPHCNSCLSEYDKARDRDWSRDSRRKKEALCEAQDLEVLS